jgi:type II secretory pathway pseudopilin PulG
MKYKINILIIVTVLSVFAIIASTSFLDKNNVFAQSSIFGNLFNNFGNMFGSSSAPQSKTSTAPAGSGSPSSVFDNAAPSNSDKSKMLGILFGNAPSGTPGNTPSSIPVEKSGPPSNNKVKFHVGEHYKGFIFNHKKASESKAKSACNGNTDCIGCIEHRSQLGNELTGYEAVKCLKDPIHSY